MRSRKTKGGFAKSVDNLYTIVIKDENGNDRFHINDLDSEIDKKALKAIIKDVEITHDSYEPKLKQILPHWKGYQYYPDLKDIQVIIDYQEDNINMGEYDPELDTITLNVHDLILSYEKHNLQNTRMATSHQRTSRENKSQEEEAQRSKDNYLVREAIITLFHELQHAIQQREGIKVFETDEDSVLSFAREKYGEHDLSKDEFRGWLVKKHNTNTFREAFLIEYRSMPSEAECMEVESQFTHFSLGGILNKRVSFKDLFSK